jgi:hypothetical protein
LITIINWREHGQNSPGIIKKGRGNQIYSYSEKTGFFLPRGSGILSITHPQGEWLKDRMSPLFFKKSHSPFLPKIISMGAYVFIEVVLGREVLLKFFRISGEIKFRIS